MIYGEFPVDNIVSVKWHKKKDDGGGPGPGDDDLFQTCGMFENGLLGGGPINFSGFYTLDTWNLYMHIPDTNPTHSADKPWMYFPCFQDYVTMGITTTLPYIWHAPSSWTITFDRDRGPGPYPVRFNVWYNVNPQRILDNPAPDQIILGEVAEVVPSEHPGGTYPPFFTLEMDFPATGWTILHYPHLLVQAHCKHTTFGAMPPQIPGWGTFFDPYSLIPYPIPGGLSLPIRPAPPTPGTRRALVPDFTFPPPPAGWTADLVMTRRFMG